MNRKWTIGDPQDHRADDETRKTRKEAESRALSRSRAGIVLGVWSPPKGEGGICVSFAYAGELYRRVP